jgi:lysophospholipase
LSITQYYGNIYDDVSGKAAAGFNTTITDYWGRGLSYQFVNASDGGPSANMILKDSYQLLTYHR